MTPMPISHYAADLPGQPMTKSIIIFVVVVFFSSAVDVNSKEYIYQPDIDLSSLSTGDIVWVCGLHEAPPPMRPASGVIIDGACKDNPGVIFHAGFKLTDHGKPDANGIYALRLGGQTGDQVIEGMTTRLKKAGRMPDASWALGSFYHDADNKILYYKPTTTPKPLYTSDGLSAIIIKDVYDVTVRNLAIRNTATGDGAIHISNAPFTKIINTNIRWATTKAIYGHNSNYVVISKNEIRDVANGIYFIDSRHSRSNHVRITENKLYDIDQDDYYGHDDAHGIAMQGGSFNKIIGNTIIGAGGSGITMFAFKGQKQKFNRVEDNYIENIRTFVERKSAVSRVERGIETGGINANDPENVVGNTIKDNTIVDVEQECIRTKSTMAKKGPGWSIIDNTTRGCGVAFAWSEGSKGDPGFVLKGNNFTGAKHLEQQHYNKNKDHSGIVIENNTFNCP